MFQIAMKKYVAPLLKQTIRNRSSLARIRPFPLASSFTPRSSTSLLDDFFNDTFLMPTSSAIFRPHHNPVNIEDNKVYKVSVDMPGIPKSAIKVYFDDDNYLVVEGERKSVVKADTDAAEGEVESWGQVYKKLFVPSNVIRDSVKSKLDHGVLEIIFDKTENETEEKKLIEIE